MQKDEGESQIPDEQVQELEEESDSSLQDTDTSGDEALDKIEDVETLRGEAKKWFHIAKRHENKPKVPKPEPQAQPQSSDNLTKRDLHRINTKKARQLAQLSDKPEDNEITEHWDDIVPFATTSVRGQDTEQDILEAMRDGHAAWKRNQPAPKPADAGAELQKDTQAQRPSSQTAPTGERKSDRLLRKREGMDSWYKPKE
jgi:hypothetical protein